MFLYITLGTNDLSRAKRFYDAVMPTLGQQLRAVEPDEVGYGPPAPARTCLWVTRPYDGKPATTANGSMPAFTATSRTAVDAFHAAGLAHGGSDEGAPGLRPYGPHFYACYLRDPDGNKLSAVCEVAPD
jgi:catechol 2,3-dioxygenase-like lactoylglutathione lyase family enzyme